MTEIDEEIKDPEQEIEDLNQKIKHIQHLLDLNWHKKAAIKDPRKTNPKEKTKKLRAVSRERTKLNSRLKEARKNLKRLKDSQKNINRDRQVIGMNPAIRTGRNRNFAPHR